MKLLVFQHIAVEHPGVFREFLSADDIAWDAVELDAGEAIPSLDDYDALWVMGGPMDVWETVTYPWLEKEQDAIREAVVDRAMPVLGICLGHQLLATALGGAVGAMAVPEIGICEFELAEAGAEDPIFSGLPRRGQCLQWHGAEVSRPPEGAEVLASSLACAVQAMRVGHRAYGFQYHVELTRQTIPEWGCVPVYKASLEEAMGPDALDAFQKAAEARLDDFRSTARRIYENFKELAG